MSDKELNAAAGEQWKIVKNRKYKKTDIFVSVLCLFVALVIWIYATNVKNDEMMKKHEELIDSMSEVSEQART